MSRGRVEVLPLTSEVLRDNPLGDPHERELPVYLPPGYDQDDRRYPTLYVLAGYTGAGRMMLQPGAWEESLDTRMDRLIAQGCPPAILVMPDCFTRLGGSQYLNSSALGRYQDHLVQEIVPAVDAALRTHARAAGRGVLGKSSGGYGALRMGLFHADVFGAVGCHSGDLAFDLCYRPDFPRFLGAVERAGGVEAFVQQFFAKPKKTGHDIMSMSVLAMAAAYSPDPDQPLGIALPFDLHSGELDEAVWQRWRAQDPVHLVEQHAAALRSLRCLFVDCGTRDEYNLQYGARQFAARCRAHDVPVIHQEFDDDHRGLSYRYDVSFPLLLKHLEPAS